MSARPPDGGRLPAPVADPAPTTPLRTVSIRARVAWVVLAVLTLVLLVLGVAVDTVFTVQSERNLDTQLNGRVQLARQLARSGVGPAALVNRVQTSGVRAQLTLVDGEVFGEEPPAASRLRTVSTTLAGPGRLNGARLVLSVDTAPLDRADRTLRRVLLLAGLGALVLAAVLVLLALRYALAPLDAMAALARRITAGSRGFRLRPTRPGTEIGQTAAALDAMLDELEGAERRALTAEGEAVGMAEQTRTFLADAAHELRTPITGIRAAAETLLHSGAALTPSERERLEVLLAQEAERAGTLVSDLLAAARLDAGLNLEYGPVDLSGLLRGEADRARLLQPGVRVEVTEPGRLWLQGDRDKISGILRNLTDNAVRAAAPDGAVRLEADARDGQVHVLVSDSGSGVPPADRERIFDRLVRLDHGRSRSTGGSGLGLAIARGYARAHGGDLVCGDPPLGRQRPLSGACFWLRLPLRPAPGANPAEQGRLEPGRLGPGRLEQGQLPQATSRPSS